MSAPKNDDLFLVIHKADPNWFKPGTNKTDAEIKASKKRRVLSTHELPGVDWLRKEQEKAASHRSGGSKGAETICSEKGKEQAGGEAGCEVSDMQRTFEVFLATKCERRIHGNQHNGKCRCAVAVTTYCRNSNNILFMYLLT